MAYAFSQTGSAAQSYAKPAAVGFPSNQIASSDQELMARVAGGDQLAMRSMFARHQTSLFRWLVRLVGDRALAEDLLSDVFLDVWRQANRFKGHCAVSTWLFSIARNKAISAKRKRVDAALDGAQAENLCDPAEDLQRSLEEKDRNQVLRQALRQLSSDHRQVMDLVYYHDKSVKEVAAIVGIGEATVKTRMFYARKRLAELVQQG